MPVAIVACGCWAIPTVQGAEGKPTTGRCASALLGDIQLPSPRHRGHCPVTRRDDERPPPAQRSGLAAPGFKNRDGQALGEPLAWVQQADPAAPGVHADCVAAHEVSSKNYAGGSCLR